MFPYHLSEADRKSDLKVGHHTVNTQVHVDVFICKAHVKSIHDEFNT